MILGILVGLWLWLWGFVEGSRDQLRRRTIQWHYGEPNNRSGGTTYNGQLKRYPTTDRDGQSGGTS